MRGLEGRNDETGTRDSLFGIARDDLCPSHVYEELRPCRRWQLRVFHTARLCGGLVIGVGIRRQDKSLSCPDDRSLWLVPFRHDLS